METTASEYAKKIAKKILIDVRLIALIQLKKAWYEKPEEVMTSLKQLQPIKYNILKGNK